MTTAFSPLGPSFRGVVAVLRVHGSALPLTQTHSSGKPQALQVEAVRVELVYTYRGDSRERPAPNLE